MKICIKTWAFHEKTFFVFFFKFTLSDRNGWNMSRIFSLGLLYDMHTFKWEIRRIQHIQTMPLEKCNYSGWLFPLCCHVWVVYASVFVSYPVNSTFLHIAYGVSSPPPTPHTTILNDPISRVCQLLLLRNFLMLESTSREHQSDHKLHWECEAHRCPQHTTC